MRSLLLIGNKEERFLVRTLMKDLGDVISPSSYEEALQILKLNPQPVMTAIFDERYEQRFSSQSVVQSTSDISRSQMSTSEFIDEIRKLGVLQVQTQYAVILADDRDSSQTLLYSEMGADMVLSRPLGSNEIKNHFENFFKMVRNPSAAVRMMKHLRGLVENQKYPEAHASLLNYLGFDKENPQAQLLYAKTLLNLGSESFLKGIDQLKLLDQKYPRSILVKKMLRDSLVERELFGEAHLCSERIYVHEPSRKHFTEMLETARVLFQKNLDSRVFLKMSQSLIKEGWALRKKEISTLWSVFLEVFEKDPSSEKIEILVQGLNEQFQKKDAEILEIKNEISEALTRIYSLTKSFSESLGPERSRQTTWDLALHILDVRESEGRLLLDLVDLARGNKEAEKKLWKRLESALGGPGSISSLGQSLGKTHSGTQKKVAAEVFIAIAQHCLDQDLLKEASDAIFSGKRVSPGDARLEVLSKRWRELYDAKQKTV